MYFFKYAKFQIIHALETQMMFQLEGRKQICGMIQQYFIIFNIMCARRLS